jgi:hypothetical protein
MSMRRRNLEPCGVKAGVKVWSDGLFLCLVLAVGSGCARHDVFRPADAKTGSSDPQRLPFHQNSERAADDESRPAVPPDAASGAPFYAAMHGRTLPSGTLITVSLNTSFSVAGTHPGDSFTALLAGPVTVDGDRLIERGTPVSGVVESVQPPARTGGAANPGLLRLTLRSIGIDGRSVSLQTSSLFARWALPSAASVVPGVKPRPSDYQLLKGHHLTFRLIAPAVLIDTNSLAERRAPEAGK